MRILAASLLLMIAACDETPKVPAAATDAPAAAAPAPAPAPSTPVVKAGEPVLFGAAANTGSFLVQGFAQPDNTGTWTDGTKATLRLTLPGEARGKKIRVVLDAVPYLSPPTVVSQKISVSVAGAQLASWEMEVQAPPAPYSFDVGPELTAADAIDVVFDIPNASSPSSNGGADRRVLGLYLVSATVTIAP